MASQITGVSIVQVQIKENTRSASLMSLKWPQNPANDKLQLAQVFGAMKQ